MNPTTHENFLQDFAVLSAFGATGNGGVDRQAGSAADGEQRAWLSQLLTDHGFEVVYDRIGNQFGTIELVPGAPYVLVGSHLDSQPTAGKYDGAYGVLAAAHSAFELLERYRGGNLTPQYNLAVVNWFNEEGSRFKPSMMGSSVYTGKLSLEDSLNTQDVNGTTVAEALEFIRSAGSEDGPVPAFAAELHVEQGRTMEDNGITIGVVDSNWAASKYDFMVYGEQAHTGSTAMEDRQDALLGASKLVVAAREIADAFPGKLHSSVGQLNVYPNSPVVVPSQVQMLLDLRSADEETLAQANEMLQERIRTAEEQAKVSIEQRGGHAWPVTPYQVEGVELAERCAERLEMAHSRVMTLAGHDSTNMKDVVPTVMLFVPSVEGISHNEREFSHDEDLLAGLDMLTEVTHHLLEGSLAS